MRAVIIAMALSIASAYGQSTRGLSFDAHEAPGINAIMSETRNVALVIGTDDYDHWNKLTNPVYDASSIAKILKEDYNYEVSLLTNPSKSQIELTLLQLYKQFKTYPENSNTNLLIFIAGHGGFDEYVNGFIVCKESLNSDDLLKNTCLSHLQLRDRIDKIPAKHTMVILDVCFGGTFSEQISKRSPGHRGGDDDATIGPIELIQRKEPLHTRKYFTSGGKSYVPDGRPGKHSPFANKVIDLLIRNYDQKKVITFADFCSHLQYHKPEPCAGGWGDDDDAGSDFILVPRSLSLTTATQGPVGTVAAAPTTGKVSFATQHPPASVPNGGQLPQTVSRGDDPSVYVPPVADKPQPPVKKEPLRKEITPVFEPQMVALAGGYYSHQTEFRAKDAKGDVYSDITTKKVEVAGFSIGKYEVTQAEWAAVMGSNPSANKGCDKCPVEQVSWTDVQRYIAKLNQLTGRNYRLATEVEWEYAASGGNAATATKYSGDNDVAAVAWTEDNSMRRTHTAGAKKANSAGLYDMSGNVWEWCSDKYGKTAGNYIIKGGGYIGSTSGCLVSGNDYRDASARENTIGFRLVLATK